MPDIKAVVFDMDGVIVDSEPLWLEVENQVYGRYGIAFTAEVQRQVMGRGPREVVRHLAGHLPEADQDEILAAKIAGVAKKVRTDAVAMPGALEAIEKVQKMGVPLAIASSAFYLVIDAVLEKFDLADAFQVVHSGEDEANGKPNPDIYLTAASKLGVDPHNCLGIEDSVNGVKSAIAAGYTCIAVPDPGLRDDEQFELAHVKLDSLEDFDDELWDALNALD